MLNRALPHTTLSFLTSLAKNTSAYTHSRCVRTACCVLRVDWSASKVPVLYRPTSRRVVSHDRLKRLSITCPFLSTPCTRSFPPCERLSRYIEPCGVLTARRTDRSDTKIITFQVPRYNNTSRAISYCSD